MRPALFGVMVALVAAGAFAQEIHKRDIDPRGADANASGGATAPRPAFSRDASASQALFQRLESSGYQQHYMMAFGTQADLLEGRDFFVACARNP